MQIDIPLEVLVNIKQCMPTHGDIQPNYCSTEIHDKKLCGFDLVFNCMSKEKAETLNYNLNRFFQILSKVYISDYSI